MSTTTTMTGTLEPEVRRLQPSLSETRRTLHQHPELGFQEGRLAGTVKLVFQPAEEGPGGAKPMIEAGVLESPRVDAAFGIHLLNDHPLGTVALRPGPLMAATDRVVVRVVGKGGHGASPHQAVDAVLVAAHVVTALQAISAREVAPTTPVVVTMGTVHGGFRYNVIA